MIRAVPLVLVVPVGRVVAYVQMVPFLVVV